MGLYEVMPMTEEIERLTVERASLETIKAVAMEQGMISLRRRPREGAHGRDLDRGSREGGGSDVSMAMQEEEDVQVPVPELLGALLDHGGSDRTDRGLPPVVVHGELERSRGTRLFRRGLCRA